MMEQLTHWTVICIGSRIGYFRGNIQGLTDDIKCLKPTFFPVVPRLLNRLYDAVTGKIQQQGFIARLVYNFAFARKLSLVRSGKTGRDTVWDRLVFKKIQDQVGGNVDLMVTGSAPCSASVLETCRVTLGATIVEGYGQTECTALATCAWMGDPSTGHCGAPAACALIKLADVPDLNYYSKDGKGEIRIKGPCVTKGYYKDPERTAELFDEDGFLQTGDIGEVLPNGCIRIIDRKKHIFKLAQGEYVAPEKIENVYIRTPVAQQVYVDGDSLQRWLIAVVVPEPEVLLHWNEKNGNEKRSIQEICNDEKAKQYVLSELHTIGKANKLNSIEQVKKVILAADPFTVENGLLTPTLKAKRPQLRLKYKDQMAKIYAAFPNL
uniref:long-chain-fatty-acid--CoA ligase n=1 Tax=Caenorhabditis japonica TaxID=281687 RepID=A0A8R1DZ20_CAEJA